MIISGNFRDYGFLQNFKKIIPKFQRADILLCTWPRRIYRDGLYWDLYTDELINELEMSYLAIERSNFGHNTPIPHNNIHYLDFVWLMKELMDVYPLKLIPGFESNGKGPGNWSYKQNELLKNYLRYLFDRVKPSVVVLAAAHPWNLVRDIAVEKNIVTIFLQEGIEPVNPQTDYAMTWGKDSADFVFMNAIGTTCVVGGYPWLNAYTNKTKRQKICVLGDWRSKKMRSELAAKLSNYFDDLEVVFVPHPSARRYNDDIYHLNESYEIFTGTNAYEEVANSSWVVGSSSTLMFEAKYLDCSVISFDPPSKAVPRLPFPIIYNVEKLIKAIENHNVRDKTEFTLIDHSDSQKQKTAFLSILERENIF